MGLSRISSLLSFYPQCVHNNLNGKDDPFRDELESLNIHFKLETVVIGHISANATLRIQEKFEKLLSEQSFRSCIYRDLNI